MAATAFDAAGLAAAAQAASQPLDSDLTAIAALSTTAYGRCPADPGGRGAPPALLNTATPPSRVLMSATDKVRLDAKHVGVYNVLDYGIAPANTAAANLTAWNTLMTTIVDNGVVFFPPGPSAYQFSGTCAIPSGRHLRVCGAATRSR